jgi:hypothetical protein
VPRNSLTSRRIFWSLAFAATVLFLASGEAGSGSRSLKNFWEARDKAAMTETGLPAPGTLTVS